VRELYEEYFRVTEDSAVPEKVMYSRAVFSLIIVLLIMGIMAFTAYAYFGLYVNSPSTTVEAAYIHTDMTVTQDGQTVTSGDAGLHTVLLEAGKTYTITLKPTGTAQTGFAMLKFTDNDTVYHTQQLGADEAVAGKKTGKIQFTVASEETVTMEIKASWGTSSYYGKVDKSAEKYVFDGESLIFGQIESQEEQPDDTTEEENTEEVTTDEDTSKEENTANQTPEEQPSEEPTVETPSGEDQTQETTAPAEE